MRETALDKELKHLKAVEEDKKAKKLGLYYTTQSLLGINWWTWAWIIGARGRGKSFSVLDTVLSYQKKYGAENVKCYYFRISDLSVKAMLANKARKAIDALLVRKYNLELTTKAYTVYNRGKAIIDFYALVSAAKTGKGVAEYDPEFLNNRPIDPKTGKKVKRFIFMIIDEFMMAEGLEKRSVGNPVEQFKIFVENILRDQEQLDYPAVRIFGCANAVSECSDFLAQLANFIPEKPGRFKLKRKHMIVDNIINSEAYLEKRKKSISADILDYENDSNYTNVVKRDLDTLMKKNRKLVRVTSLIKFDKDPSHWYCLWDGKIIKKYNGQRVNKSLVLSMKRYLDENFYEQRVKAIFEMYDARAFLYSDLISQATFTSELKLIKKQ
jgi:hypothetical protein